MSRSRWNAYGDQVDVDFCAITIARGKPYFNEKRYFYNENRKREKRLKFGNEWLRKWVFLLRKSMRCREKTSTIPINAEKDLVREPFPRKVQQETTENDRAHPKENERSERKKFGLDNGQVCGCNHESHLRVHFFFRQHGYLLENNCVVGLLKPLKKK